MEWSMVFIVLFILAVCGTIAFPERWWMWIILSVVFVWGVGDFLVTFLS